MDINKERELFLAHMRSIGSARFMFDLDEDGNFDDMSMAYAWSAWQAAKAQAVPEGFILVEKEKINTWYQDDNEPENFCNSIDALDSLGDCIDHDEIMIVNKHIQAHLSTEKLYGAWGVIETSYGTRWKFKLFNTENEAKSAIVEAQEQAND